ncbi:hypothetical protein [Modestobacter lacusdianchii]
MHDAGPGPETTGRHRRGETTPPLTDTGRHRAVIAELDPTPEPARRRHAADVAPKAHPDAVRRRRSRAPQRILAGTALLAVALAPVLARSNSALGLHDALAAEVAAHPDRATDTLEAISRGGLIGTATSAPARDQTTTTDSPSGGGASTAGTPSGRSSAASSADPAPAGSAGGPGTTAATPDVADDGTAPAPGDTVIETATPPTSQRTEQEQTTSVPSPDGTPDATVLSQDDAPLPLPAPTNPAPTATSTSPAPEPTTSAPQPTETSTPMPTESPAETSGAIGEIIDLVGDLIGG